MTKPVFTAKDMLGPMPKMNRIHPQRAADRANARLAPLMAALERWENMPLTLTWDEWRERGAAVQAEYRKLVSQ